MLPPSSNNNIVIALNNLLPIEHQRTCITDMVTDKNVMAYMYNNYETFEASGLLSSDEFINIANKHTTLCYFGTDIAETTVSTNRLNKKVLIISMKLHTAKPVTDSEVKNYPWSYIDNKTKAVGYRPDGVSQLVSRISVPYGTTEYDCTNIVKGKFASQIAQLPYDGNCNIDYDCYTQYCTAYYISCE